MTKEELEKENYLNKIDHKEEVIKTLQEMIEKMKCSRNCRHPKTPIDNICVDCENYSKWELRR